LAFFVRKADKKKRNRKQLKTNLYDTSVVGHQSAVAELSLLVAPKTYANK